MLLVTPLMFLLWHVKTALIPLYDPHLFLTLFLHFFAFCCIFLLKHWNICAVLYSLGFIAGWHHSVRVCACCKHYNSNLNSSVLLFNGWSVLKNEIWYKLVQNVKICHNTHFIDLTMGNTLLPTPHPTCEDIIFLLVIIPTETWQSKDVIAVI